MFNSFARFFAIGNLAFQFACLGEAHGAHHSLVWNGVHALFSVFLVVYCMRVTRPKPITIKVTHTPIVPLKLTGTVVAPSENDIIAEFIDD